MSFINRYILFGNEFRILSDYIYKKSGHVCLLEMEKRRIKIPLWSRNNHTNEPDAYTYIVLGLREVSDMKDLFDKWYKETRHLYKTDFTKDNK